MAMPVVLAHPLGQRAQGGAGAQHRHAPRTARLRRRGHRGGHHASAAQRRERTETLSRGDQPAEHLVPHRVIDIFPIGRSGTVVIAVPANPARCPARSA